MIMGGTTEKNDMGLLLVLVICALAKAVEKQAT